MERREASRAKRARLLSPNQISEIVLDSDSDEAQCDAPSKEDEEVEPRPSPASASSHTPSSPDFSASTSEDKDAVQHMAGQQPQSKQWTQPPWPPKGKSSGSAHITGESTPLSILLLFFSEIITLLAVEKNRYDQEYLHLFDDGPSPQPDVTEAEMLRFWLWRYRWAIQFKADWRTTGRNWSSFAVHSTDKRYFADNTVTHFGFCTSRTVAGTELTGRMTATTDYGN